MSNIVKLKFPNCEYCGRDDEPGGEEVVEGKKTYLCHVCIDGLCGTHDLTEEGWVNQGEQFLEKALYLGLERGLNVERVRDEIYLFPDFIHEIPLMHDIEDPQSHSTRKLFGLHIAIDLIFYRIRRWLINHDALPGCYIFNAALGFLWGLNCRFPARDVALYTVWYHRGCKPLKVFTFRGGM